MMAPTLPGCFPYEISGSLLPVFILATNVGKVGAHTLILFISIPSTAVTAGNAIIGGRPTAIMQRNKVDHDLEWPGLTIGTLPMEMVECMQPIDERQRCLYAKFLRL